jgi:hypothetical protein
MGMFVDLSGMVFGYLKVLSHAGVTERRQSMWLARCRCGREITVRGDALTRLEKRSCGECKKPAESESKPRVTVIANRERDQGFF